MSSEESSPGFAAYFQLILGALFGVSVGAVLAAVHLLAQPVKLVEEMPDEIKPAQHYVLQGRTGGGDAWKYKATELQEGTGEVTLLETELNRWAASFKTEYPEEKSSLYVEPQRPLFRLEGDKLMVSAPAQSGFGSWTRLITLSLEGDFVPDAAILRIQPEKLYLGSLRVPGPAKDFVWKRISSSYTIDEEFESLWSIVGTANIQESQLVLTAK